jgi:tetratricopeptide (TPR) repeat protein
MTYEGPVLRVLALLDESLGDHASAERALRQALGGAAERGYRAWVAQLDYDLGRVLSAMQRKEEARAAFARAATLAAELGMTGLVARARVRAAEVHPASTSVPRTIAKIQSGPASPPSFDLLRDGDVWKVTYGRYSASVRDTRGMQLLHRLVERAGVDLHVLTLVSDEGTPLVEPDAGATVDVRALREYRQRLRDLQGELEEAERNADLGRVEILCKEREALEGELRRNVGLGGRTRATGSVSERARVNVQRRLKDALARIEEAQPEIARYLEKAVRTGTYCSFRP